MQSGYWVTFRAQNTSLNCCQSFEQKLCSQLGQDLSKEVLWVSGDQRATKIQVNKAGGLKKNLTLSKSPSNFEVDPIVLDTNLGRTQVADFFSNLQIR